MVNLPTFILCTNADGKRSVLAVLCKENAPLSEGATLLLQQITVVMHGYALKCRWDKLVTDENSEGSTA